MQAQMTFLFNYLYSNISSSLHMPPSTFRAFITGETRRTNTITTSIADPPGPILRELFSATHTWNKHKQTSFKLI